MIITIDGYDGTGKTTLAKKISNDYDFIYVYKPYIWKIQHEKKCSYEEACNIANEREKYLFSNCSNIEIVKFYLDALLWYKDFSNNRNAILDRGLLTIYAVLGNEETASTFKNYIEHGAFFDASIYLIADDYERVRRIKENDPNDPDLKYPVEWRKNDLLQFADEASLNYFKVDTNRKNPDIVYLEAQKILKDKMKIKKMENI